MKCASHNTLLSAVAGLFLLLVGCQTPPAATMLIHVAEQTIADEQSHLESDAGRQAQWYDQQRATLAAGFEADLQQRDVIDTQWVMQGVRVYTTAREAIVEQQMQDRQQLQTRRENLRLAGQALSRARALLQQRDQLLWSAPQLRQWINQQLQPNTQTETQP